MSKFVDALEACVREAAARVAATSHVWHDHCVSPGEKTRVQVEQLAPLMDEMRVEWGYPGALWCAFWSAPMPDEPFQRAWSEDLLCPWRIYEDGDGHLNCPNGLDQGPVPDKDAINTLNQLQQSYYGVTLHVMPCAVCREMKARFGNQRYEPFVARGTPDRNAMFSNGKGWPNQWDLHPFGVWLARDGPKWAGWGAADIVELINKFRLENGEIIHGYVWESLYRLPRTSDAVAWVADASAKTWTIDRAGTGDRGWGFSGRESNWEFAHASGHGYFYHFGGDLVAAMRACWDTSVEKRFRGHGLRNMNDLWSWRWVCSDGAFHSAFNELDVATLKRMADAGVTSIKQHFCDVHAAASAVSRDSGSPVWDHKRPGDCPAGLGADEAQVRLDLVKAGKCEHILAVARSSSADGRYSERDSEREAAAAKRESLAAQREAAQEERAFARANPHAAGGGGGACVDDSGYANSFGLDCVGYEAAGYCRNGAPAAGKEWAMGAEYGHPERACCACGKGRAAAAAAACVDTPKWHNRYKADCGRYIAEGHCIGGGAAKGHEWALGAEFDYPERSCCACGKGRTSTGHVVH